jgi:hypothetical protein
MENSNLTPIYSVSLKTAIDEIRNITPEVSCAFIFRQDGEVIAQDDTADPTTVQEAIQFFNETSCRVNAVEDFENLTIRGSSGQVNFSACTNGFYLATVSSKMVDEKTLFALNRVLLPVVIKVIQQLSQNSEVKEILTAETKSEEAKNEETVEEIESEVSFTQPQRIEPVLPDAPVHQFMVEKIGGLLVSSDTIRIDGEVIASWDKLFEGKAIEYVLIETLKMKTFKCKFKPIKEKKNTTKGIVQFPERILQMLDVSKGELVMIKPVI